MRRFLSLKQHVRNSSNRADINIKSLVKFIDVYYNVVRICIKDAHFNLYTPQGMFIDMLCIEVIAMT